MLGRGGERGSRFVTTSADRRGGEVSSNPPSYWVCGRKESLKKDDEKKANVWRRDRKGLKWAGGAKERSYHSLAGGQD